MHSVVASAVNHPDAIEPYRGLFNHRILKSLDDSNLELQVVSPRPFAPPKGPYSEYASLPDTEDWGSYTVHHPRFWYLLPKRVFYGFAGNSFASRVPEYVEEQFQIPDVVHACHIYLDGYGMLPYVREHELPLFVTAHGMLMNSFDQQPRDVRRKIRETLTEAAGVLSVSDALASKARELTDPKKVTTVPIGADPGKFPVEHRDRLRRELDIPPEATVVLFVGAFTERKGIPEIAELLPRLELSDTVFVFVGHGGELEGELREAVVKSDYSNRFVYTGVTSLALRRWFAAADLLMLPSHAEGRPTVIYEAMASRTAVLASAVGGVPEQVVDGETGLLVEPGDVDALEATLRAVTDDPERLDALGSAGYERLMEKNWTWNGYANRVRELHEAAME